MLGGVALLLEPITMRVLGASAMMCSEALGLSCNESGISAMTAAGQTRSCGLRQPDGSLAPVSGHWSSAGVFGRSPMEIMQQWVDGAAP